MKQDSYDRAKRKDEILVLGFGNPLMGDDGAGVLATEMLADALLERSIPAKVRVEFAGVPGLDLPNWLEGHTAVMLVDAIDMRQEPGTWHCFQLHDAPFDNVDNSLVVQPDGNLSLHQSGLASGLALAQNLDLLPENLWLFGIQPDRIVQESSLSPKVSAGLPGLVTGILNEIGKAQL